MVWEQLTINKPHLAYIILGGFTSLFMLVSLFVKERMYIGEATVATICGIIFGPHAANLFDPSSWGNVDQITLECSRIVLVVQCFAVGVELPKSYMERHWKSVVLLLVPVMTFGWLITSLFIWWMIEPLSWLESLCCAACVTATDPVLASSVVGKGKFAKRVPKHLRDLLSAESGCNDGMAFPFIFLALYLIRYRPDAGLVIYNWACLTILYECVFGAVYGVLVGYGARHAIKWAERHEIIDRESFLVFYFTLALFCAGSGSLLGLDDLLVGFAAGVGFSNDGWFQEKTEESHVSNVIDLLLNLAYFVYFGSIIPWNLYNTAALGTSPWRLVVIAIFVILFRRIPIMLALKPIIPDIKNWREAIFAGHFGPIGVGAIFVSILARAELEHEDTTPLADLPAPGTENYTIVQLIWPITTFLVLSSILVHGSSIAVFTLGKHINTLTITMSYTQANEEGPNWMNRLPRIASQSKSQAKGDSSDAESSNEKFGDLSPPGTLGPTGVPGNFLRRQKEEDSGSRPSSMRPLARKKKWDSGMGPGGPISQSAIAPRRRQESGAAAGSASDTLNEKDSSPSSEERGDVPATETYQEGDHLIIEDEGGNVIHEENTGPSAKVKRERIKEEIGDDIEHPSHPYHNLRKKLGHFNWGRHNDGSAMKVNIRKPNEHKRGPALAYQYGNTIIVEDEDGEVVKKYDIPATPRRPASDRKTNIVSRPQLRGRMGTWLGKQPEEASTPGQDAEAPQGQPDIDDDDTRIRFTAGGRRMSKVDFIKQIQQLDPKARSELVENSDAPAQFKQEVKTRAHVEDREQRSDTRRVPTLPTTEEQDGNQQDEEEEQPRGRREESPNAEPLERVTTEREVPFHSIRNDLRSLGGTAAQRRRQAAAASATADSPTASTPSRRLSISTADSDDDGTERVPPSKQTSHDHHGGAGGGESLTQRWRRKGAQADDGTETAAERRRREGALASSAKADDEDSDDDNTPRQPPARVGIRFAEDPRPKNRR
jgi:NhaP-type Na+/H+ or K+/H+ antiporter